MNEQIYILVKYNKAIANNRLAFCLRSSATAAKQGTTVAQRESS